MDYTGRKQYGLGLAMLKQLSRPLFGTPSMVDIEIRDKILWSVMYPP